MATGSFIRAQRIQLVEIIIPQNSTALTYNVPDQPMLRNKRIDAIQVLVGADMQQSPISGNKVLSNTELVTTSPALSMYSADPVNEADTGEYLYRVPLVSMHTYTGGQSAPYNVQNITFDDLFIMWDKCTLSFQAIPNVTASPTSILLLVFYTSRTQRITSLLSKKLSGITDGDMAQLLSTKIMQLENQLDKLMDWIKRK